MSNKKSSPSTGKSGLIQSLDGNAPPTWSSEGEPQGVFALGENETLESKSLRDRRKIETFSRKARR